MDTSKDGTEVSASRAVCCVEKRRRCYDAAMASLRLASLDEARRALADLSLAARSPGPWSLAEVLVHCAQSIEYSLDGFPRAKPWLFRVTVGRLALAMFLRRGAMSHDPGAAIPGAPPPHATDAAAARERLVAAIDRFGAHEGALAPHFAYGAVDKARYDLVQAMHVADHLSRFA
jgi:hypothetical protein